MSRTPLAVLVTLAVAAPAHAQETRMHAGALTVGLARLRTTARVLYVAAHPDDENTRLLAYLANQRHLDVGYLSLTRGGGGQNLIGTEQGALLAAVRTQELLAARRIDGARQFFTRARDFGYCKHPDEAIQKWGEQDVLHDVVWVIRTFRPDVIITRFTEAGPSHGHHTASARLARAAFEAAGDPKRFSAQGLAPWAPTRLVLNVPRWGRAKDDVSGYLALDVGGYDARLGASYGEIAARSRTMHKSQGFGSAGRRGPVMEYFEPLAGPRPTEDVLEGVALGWDRYPGAAAIDAALAQAQAAFRVEAPERIVQPLAEAHAALERLIGEAAAPDPRLLDRKRDVERLITSSLGLFVRAAAPRAEVAASETLEIEVEALLRRPAEVEVTALRFPGGAVGGAALRPHAPQRWTRAVTVPEKAAPSRLPWLTETPTQNRYAGPTRDLVAPEGPAPLQVEVELSVAGRRLTLDVPVRRYTTDRVHGERARAVQVLPALTATPERAVALLVGGRAAKVAVHARAGRDSARGRIALTLPEGWRTEPATHAVELAKRGEEVRLVFTVTPPSASAPPAQAKLLVDGAPGLRRDTIDHPHLPAQVILQPATLRLAPLDFLPPPGRIGYIPGPGDTVAEHLGAAGVAVQTVDEATLASGQLDEFDVLLVGVRAYNTRGEALRAAHPALMAWVKGGGRLVAQYNTSNRWRRLDLPMGPYPFEIDRGRVTDERAALTPLDPRHTIMRTPNRLRPEDFEGWVQERGLYFAKTWDARYAPVFSSHDPGEAPLKGSLLVTKYGKGAFVYTGLSFFRQLPAGVPGAYRLLANVLSFGARP